MLPKMNCGMIVFDDQSRSIPHAEYFNSTTELSRGVNQKKGALQLKECLNEILNNIVGRIFAHGHELYATTI